MSLTFRTALAWLFIFFSLSGCKKEEIINDQFVNPSEQTAALHAEVSGAGYHFIALSWNKVLNSYFKTFTYSLYVDGKEIVSGLNTTKYNIINLEAGRTHQVTIKALSNKGDVLEQNLQASTLELQGKADVQLYSPFSFYSFATITNGIGMKKLPDGGYLVVKLIQHPNYFDTDEFKIMLFRTDKFGSVLWYRLLPSYRSYLNIVMPRFFISSAEESDKAILYLGNIALKFMINDGKLIQERAYQDQMTKQIFNTIHTVSTEQIVFGTSDGDLMSIDPLTLDIRWTSDKGNRVGSMEHIQIDSRGNIYSVFNDWSEPFLNTRLLMYNRDGRFNKMISFDERFSNASGWTFQLSSIMIDAQDNLILIGKQGDYGALVVFKIDTAGTIINKAEVSNRQAVIFSYINSKGEPVIISRDDSFYSDAPSFIYTFDNALNLISKHPIPNSASYRIEGISPNDDGTYDIFLLKRPSSVDDSSFGFLRTSASE
jgi:hypothetical protein